MRVLILGGTGFVGTHLARACIEAGDETFVASRSAGRVVRNLALDAHVARLTADVTDEPSLVAAVAAARPDRIFHLAGHASVSASFGSEEEILRTNVLGTLHVLRAAREKAPHARFLYVGSSSRSGWFSERPYSSAEPT